MVADGEFFPRRPCRRVVAGDLTRSAVGGQLLLFGPGIGRWLVVLAPHWAVGFQTQS